MGYLEEIGMLGEGERLRFAYLVGFALSLVLTFGAYAIVTQHWLSGPFAITVLLLLAFAQFFMQLIFFLHLGREMSSRTRLIALCCALTAVLLLVVGSIWIMDNLNANMMSPEAMEQYMQRQREI